MTTKETEMIKIMQRTADQNPGKVIWHRKGNVVCGLDSNKHSKLLLGHMGCRLFHHQTTAEQQHTVRLRHVCKDLLHTTGLPTAVWSQASEGPVVSTKPGCFCLGSSRSIVVCVEEHLLRQAWESKPLAYARCKGGVLPRRALHTLERFTARLYSRMLSKLRANQLCLC